MSNFMNVTELCHCVHGHDFARETKDLYEIRTNTIYMASRLTLR